MKKTLSILIFLLFVQSALAQSDIPIGTWRTHFNYSQAKTLALADSKVYVATGHSIFFFDLKESSIHKLTKTDGLKEVNVSAIGYHKESGNLFLGSVNGNIEMIKDNRIYNIRDIVNAPVVASKQINGFTFQGGFAFAYTNFGISVIDIDKREIKETYFPGLDNNPLVIFGAAIYNDSIFIASEQGVMAGSLNPQVNLLDFRNWRRFNLTDGAPSMPFVSITLVNQNIVAATKDGLYLYNRKMWEAMDLEFDEEIKSISVSDDDLLITLESKMVILSEGISTTIDHPYIDKPNYAIRDQEGRFWIADSEYGLVSNHKGDYASLFPSGPSENYIYKIKNAGDKIVGIPRGRNHDGTPLNRNSSFFVFENGQWTNYLPYVKSGVKEMPPIKGLVDIDYNSKNRKTYFASFGGGVLVWDGIDFEIIDSSTDQSTLLSSFITAINVDNMGLLWMLNHNQNPTLHSLTDGNNWKSYSTGFNQASSATGLLIYENGDKWIYSENGSTGGIIVYNELKNQSLLLTSRSNEGNLPSNAVNKLVTDKDGYIWVATDNGVAFFSDPFNTLIIGSSASIPNYEGFRLFGGEDITTMAIDGANRKWIGTNLGLWLFNESGTRLIHHFTTENSPLISNEVLDIEINHSNGEIFIATSMGLMSFRGTATAPASTHQNVTIFPNPVEPGYNGVVGISGLVEDAQVKITDISGKMIWETRSQGGTATWSVTDYNGRRAASGIYLVFSSDHSGTDTFVGKIAVVN